MSATPGDERSSVGLIFTPISPKKPVEEKRVWMSRAIAEELEGMGYKVQYPSCDVKEIFGTYRITCPSGGYGGIYITQHETRRNSWEGVWAIPREDYSISLFVGCDKNRGGRLVEGILDSAPKPFGGYCTYVDLGEIFEGIFKPYCLSHEDSYESEWNGGRIGYPYIDDPEENPRLAYCRSPRQWAEILATRLKWFELFAPKVIEEGLTKFFNGGLDAMLATLQKQVEEKTK